MRTRITEEYIEEKVEAYNVAIEALREHEPMSDGDPKMAKKLREHLIGRSTGGLPNTAAETA